jgi:AcrR family transcriptional regulator
LATSSRASSRAGRPRRFDEDTERELLMEAAVEVMTRSDYLEVSVADVLAEAGVSTRSFYRHFESKESLFIAVMRRDADLVGQLLARVVANASSPRAAVEAWLDAYLACFYDPRRSRRTMLWGSAAAASPAVATAHAESRHNIVGPLVKALRAGRRSGDLCSPSPHRDAMTILALVAVAVGIPGHRRKRSAARDHVIRYAWPALGLPLPKRRSQAAAS